MEKYSKEQGAKQDRKETEDFLKELKRQNMGASLGAPGVAAQQAQRAIQLNLNIDGRTFAQALSEANNAYLGFPTQAPAFDDLGAARGGDDHQMDH